MISIILDSLASIGLRSNCGVGAISHRVSYPKPLLSETAAFIVRFCDPCSEMTFIPIRFLLFNIVEKARAGKEESK